VGIGLFDLDNDGWKDVFATKPRERHRLILRRRSTMTNAVFRNQADGTFRDVSAESGVRRGEPRTAAAIRRFQ
jgi:hypothetical protein